MKAEETAHNSHEGNFISLFLQRGWYTASYTYLTIDDT
jgi:hypothetical protein